MYKDKGFTLIELIVVIAIIAVLSGIILFSVTQYINKGKDSSVSAYLATLIPAGEVYYNAENAANGDGYGSIENNTSFCNSPVAQNAISQMPQNPSPNNGSACANGFCCAVDTTNHQSWAACVKEFSNSDSAYCVDSRGVKKEITNDECLNQIGANLLFNCQ